MLWRCTALEDLDDDHATAAAWTNRLAGIDGGTGDLRLCRRHVEHATRSGDVVGARAAGEQAVVADAVEAVRQDVDQEAADDPENSGLQLCPRASPAGIVNSRLEFSRGRNALIESPGPDRLAATALAETADYIRQRVVPSPY
jgi:hypothetical protein